MKINFLMFDILRTGGNRILLEYADLLNNKGHDVIVYKVLKPEKLTRKYNLKDFTKTYIEKAYSLMNNKKNLSKYGGYNFKIKTILLINDFFVRNADATVTSYWPFSFLLNNLNTKKGKKIYLIQAYENWNCDIDLLHQSYLLPLIKITVSNSLRLFIKSICGRESHVILNGLNFYKFYNNEKVFIADQIVISFIYYDVKFKGSIYTLEAIKKIRTEYPAILFKSFGFSKPQNFPDFIDFYEQPEDKLIRKLYCETDIFICSSLEEGFYLVPAEAMACKCAVMSTPVGAVPEFSVDNESVIFIEPKSSNDIYIKIRNLINSKEELKRLSINGYESVRKKLDWRKSISRFEEIIKE